MPNKAADLSLATKEWLRQKYVVEDVGIRAISKLLHCSPKTVSSILRANGFTVNRARIGRKWTGCGDISGTYWTALVNRARRCGWEVRITKQDAWNLFQSQNGLCHFTGVPLGFSKSTRDPTEQTASLDRLNSTLGYVPGNVVWVHKRVNWMKGDALPVDFVSWCRLVVSHHEKEQKQCPDSK